VLGGAVYVGIIQVSDKDKVRSFYEDTLGLTLVEDAPFALVFESKGTMIRVTPVPDFTPRPATTASWRVPDLAATVRALRERGVRFQDPDDADELGIWSDPGGRGKVAWFYDPDGNTLSLTQVT
jgi:catechol 2,3-dioxygenase-like lactoylglutathione lyase family enzyme